MAAKQPTPSGETSTTAARPERQSRQHSPFVWYAIVLLLIILLATAPIMSVLISSAIAEANGCVLNEGGVNPCRIGDTEWGEALMTMFVLGWLMLLTLPVGAVAFLIWLIVLVVHLGQSRRRRAAAD